MKYLLGFHWFSPSGEMPLLLFERQSRNRNDWLCQSFSLSKKGSDVSALTRPRLYAIGRADSGLLFPQLFCKKKRKKDFFEKNSYAGALPPAPLQAFKKA
ncbi:MAG TPA: hypothetical protein IAD19_01385 [Candidatus Egerieicola faecale]|uniref:Uncharacterized protein n=1 Tax=Candidatus Egerieicola faecale TaxID=2840774 RepID=A0A9D1LJR9_9FIRM|nr:hypothetical protein [Candidatus Egerieicola faecale]